MESRLGLESQTLLHFKGAAPLEIFVHQDLGLKLARVGFHPGEMILDLKNPP